MKKIWRAEHADTRDGTEVSRLQQALWERWLDDLLIGLCLVDGEPTGRVAQPVLDRALASLRAVYGLQDTQFETAASTPAARHDAIADHVGKVQFIVDFAQDFDAYDEKLDFIIRGRLWCLHVLESVAKLPGAADSMSATTTTRPSRGMVGPSLPATSVASRDSSSTQTLMTDVLDRFDLASKHLLPAQVHELADALSHALPPACAAALWLTLDQRVDLEAQSPFELLRQALGRRHAQAIGDHLLEVDQGLAALRRYPRHQVPMLRAQLERAAQPAAKQLAAQHPEARQHPLIARLNKHSQRLAVQRWLGFLACVTGVVGALSSLGAIAYHQALPWSFGMNWLGLSVSSLVIVVGVKLIVPLMRAQLEGDKLLDALPRDAASLSQGATHPAQPPEASSSADAHATDVADSDLEEVRPQ